MGALPSLLLMCEKSVSAALSGRLHEAHFVTQSEEQYSRFPALGTIGSAGAFETLMRLFGVQHSSLAEDDIRTC